MDLNIFSLGLKANFLTECRQYSDLKKHYSKKPKFCGFSVIPAIHQRKFVEILIRYRGYNSKHMQPAFRNLASGFHTTENVMLSLYSFYEYIYPNLNVFHIYKPINCNLDVYDLCNINVDV